MVDAVFQHGDTFNTNTEGKAGIYVRIKTAVFQNLFIYNAAAKYLDPAGSFTERTAFSAAFETAYVYFYAWLGEREVGRSQSCLCAVCKNFLYKFIQHTLQIAKCNVFVNHKAFQLAEHRGMGCIAVRAEYLTRNQHFDRRFFHIHNTDLSR